MTRPAPLTPANCDLRAFRDMPLDVQRFRDSDLVTEEDPETILAALWLWTAAWHQIPAASLPNDDRALSRFAGFGRSIEAWHRVKDGALRGFVECSDGRLYHRTLSEKANNAWDKRLQYEWGKAKDRHRKAMRDVPEAERTEFPDFEGWKDHREPAEPLPGKQGRLPLERAAIPAEKPSERARADRAPAPPRDAPARTEEPKKPNESRNRSAGNGGDFHRNDPDIPTEIALKGKEGKGVLREDSPTLPDSESLPPALGTDRVDLHHAVCKAAGYKPTSPTAINASLKQVEEWIEEGLDFETVVLPAIRAVVSRSEPTDRTRTLGRFRHAVAREAAKAGEARGNGAAHRPTPSPILERPDEPPEIVPIRAALLESLGPAAYCFAINEVRLVPVAMEFGDDRRPLKASGPAYAEEAVAQGRYRSAVLAAARPHGFTDIWKGNGR